MEQNLTALMSCFVRAYHHSKRRPIFDDPFAVVMLSQEERRSLSENLSAGVRFFAPDFTGTAAEALELVNDRFLAPPVLARSAFCEDALSTAVRLGCGQCVLFGAGYDTFPFRCPHPGLNAFLLDRPEMLADWSLRRDRAGLREVCPTAQIPCDLTGDGWPSFLTSGGFAGNGPAFGSLLGLVCYLKKEDFAGLLGRLAPLWSPGSTLCFDYPSENGGTESRKTVQLASGAGTQMEAAYSYREMERLLADHGFLIYEHLDEREATERFFADYNAHNPNAPMSAPKGVHYCLAVKKLQKP